MRRKRNYDECETSKDKEDYRRGDRGAPGFGHGGAHGAQCDFVKYRKELVKFIAILLRFHDDT